MVHTTWVVIRPSAYLWFCGRCCVSGVGTDPPRGGASNERNVAGRLAPCSARQVELRPDLRTFASQLRGNDQGNAKSHADRQASRRQAHVARSHQHVLCGGTRVAALGTYGAQANHPKDGAGLESLRQFNDALVAMDATLTDAEKRFGSQSQVVGPSNSWAPYRKGMAALSSHSCQAPPQANRRPSQEDRSCQRLSYRLF